MKIQYDNLATSSLLLYLDNLVLKKGEAFENTNSYFYPIDNSYNGYYTYSAPYSQFVADTSIPGATVMSGVYLDNSFIRKNQSGLFDIDYYNGKVYFNTEIVGSNRLSGVYAIKEFTVSLCENPEETLLFETKFSSRPKGSQTVTGLNNNESAYPAIYVKTKTTENEPFAFGGQETTKINYSLYIFTDSQFSLDAVAGIIRDAARSYIPLLEETEFPFNTFGGYKGATYNYDTLTAGKVAGNSGIYICDVKNVSFSQLLYSEFKKLNPDVYFKVMDMQTEYVRQPRT